MKYSITSIILLLVFSIVNPLSSLAQIAKQRLIVLSDIGDADPDDTQSAVRLLLYANEIDIEGLVATTSVHQLSYVMPEAWNEIIDGYAKVHPNLLKHDKAYPTPQALKALVKKGVPKYGQTGVGEGQDSEGSELIIKALEKNDERPLWVTAWGGANVLAQALWKIQNTRTPQEAERLYARLRVYTIGDQDNSGAYIRKTFPSVFYIVSPGGIVGGSTWGGMRTAVEGTPGNETLTNKWIAENIQQGHGALGARYPDIAYGMEGDTPSFLGLVPNGLNDMEHPNYGGWGGRYVFYNPSDTNNLPATASQARRQAPAAPRVGGALGGFRRSPAVGDPAMARPSVPNEPETRPIWTNADDTYNPVYYNPGSGRPTMVDTTTFVNNQVTVWRWKEEYQNDFAARMDWCIMDYEEANHQPVVQLTHPEEITVKSGEFFRLDASGSTDPDGDSMGYYWFQYPEVGTYKEILSFNSVLTPGLASNLRSIHHVYAPKVTSPQTVHFIVKVTDKGSPALSRYKRVIVTIVP